MPGKVSRSISVTCSYRSDKTRAASNPAMLPPTTTACFPILLLRRILPPGFGGLNPQLHTVDSHDSDLASGVDRGGRNRVPIFALHKHLTGGRERRASFADLI